MGTSKLMTATKLHHTQLHLSSVNYGCDNIRSGGGRGHMWHLKRHLIRQQKKKGIYSHHHGVKFRNENMASLLVIILKATTPINRSVLLIEIHNIMSFNNQASADALQRIGAVTNARSS